ncbi:MAG TPA: polysaccharide biosynthesis/export family protein [Opitutaceae bacterium]|nr:polysaccharide biosynthesis/export family protein [Opitutaceae bacterium]
MKPNVEPEPAPAGSPTALVARPESNGNGHYPVAYGRPRPAAAPRPTPGAEWWQLATAAARHWQWLVGAAALFAVAGVVLGYILWSGGYTATAQLVRHDTPDPQLFQPRPINPATLIGMVNSVELRTRVGAKMEPQQTADQVGARVRVAPVPNSDLVDIAFVAPDAQSAAAHANLYAQEAVRFTQDMQARDARDAASYIRHQLTGVERDLIATSNRLQELGTTVPPPAQSAFRARLDEARIELAELQSRYTDAHPLVQMQQARVAALSRQISGRPAEEIEASPSAPPGEADVLRERARTLEGERRTLAGRLQITELLAQQPPGRYQVFSPAAAERAAVDSPAMKIALFATFLGLCGLAVGLLGAVTDEAFDRRLRTPEDVRRVTQLPILARLGAVDKLTPDERSRWAFRTWTALQSRLSATPNQGLVCGVTCSGPGEGRSVWIKLLADAASKCGFRAVVITTKTAEEDTDETRRHAARPTAAAGVRFRTRNGDVKSAEPVLIHEATLNDELLGDPDEAVERMLAPEGTSIVHIPLPGWVWSLEHRKEWLASLKSWGNRENVVIFVELPPAATPEAVLLAQNLPNVLWLCDATKADALETRRQIETLRHARCNLVGAVMNRADGTPLADRFARWVPAGVPVPAMAPAALALGLFLAGAPDLAAQAQAVPPPDGGPRGSFSIVSPAQRAAWQQQLTLGPGDSLTVALYGEVVDTRTEVTVQPDGRISFLEARDVVASGLTVDQLRQKLDQELGRFRRSARTMVSPVAFRSKKYHMLGLVTERGSFVLDRPMTIVEAVARARGFETSAATGDVAEVTDLRHAFLVRNGQRQPVDFARLFTDGDLSQNIAVEPGDYFYFPPSGQREVYVLGEVNQPGPAVLNDQSTTLRAIATRGGFSERAWRGRVLVVRGSLTEPKAIPVNLSAVLSGHEADLALEPRDIIYVSPRPWYKAEELLDEAARAFTQAAVVYWTSDKVVPVVPLQR